MPAKGSCHISDDEIRESLEKAQLKLQRERGTDVTIFSPRASAMAHHIGDATTSLHWTEHCNDLIQRVCALYPGELRRRLPAAADAGRSARQLHRRARAVHQRSRVHRLQSESGSVRRLLDGSAADRQVLVSVLREDGRARRAGDGPRQRVVQSELPRDRRALHQRRHDGVHAVPDRPICSRISRPCGSSFRTAAAPCRTTGAATAAWRRT